ncbi:MFS transporter [uncultured Jatrophihabitans sp.]|uniref:MFS transporter n=1 Tax=uncultured Jatrophihabitans sp. TaxID=1610747 RepID=UPI0035C95F02
MSAGLTTTPAADGDTAVLPAPILIDHTTRRGRALVPVLMYVGLLVAIVSSLGAPLVPTIATDYHVAVGTAQWSLTVTLLVGAITSPVLGRLGDGPRRRQVLITALCVLVAGSVCAALPGEVFALLITGRALQGVGLALLPLAMSVARDHLEPDRARSTLATLSVTAVVGVGLGYPLTGLVAEHLSFHAGFWIAAVLGLIAIVAVALVVPTSGHHAAHHFDTPGALLLGAGLATLLVAISEGEDWGWSSARLVGFAVAAIVLLVTWVWHELRRQEPLVDLRQLRYRAVLTADVTGLLAGVGMYMLMSMIIRYVQTPTTTSYGLGESVVVAGLVLLPLSAASYTASKLVTYASRWVGPTRILPVGALLFALALLLFAGYRDHLWQIFVEMGIAGLAIGCSFAVMPRLIVTAVPNEDTGSALALNQVLRSIGYSIGSALSATILTAHTVAPAVLPSNRGYTVGAFVAIGLCVVTAVVSAVLPSYRRAAAGSDVDAGDIALEVEESVDAGIAGVTAYELPRNDAPSAGQHESRRAHRAEQ